MTVTRLPSAFVTCASYAAAASLPSFSVVAESTVPPAFAVAAALTFASTSPVSSVSGTWPLLVVVVEPVVVVVAFAACFVVPAPNATVAPARAHAASATAPAHFFQALVIDVLRLGSGAPISGDHGSLREPLETTENVLRVRSAAFRRRVAARTPAATLDSRRRPVSSG